jgi:hypothetical protein
MDSMVPPGRKYGQKHGQNTHELIREPQEWGGCRGGSVH